MAEKLTKEIAQKMMEIKGRVRGVAIKGDLEFILEKEGEKGLKKLEEEIARVGYPIRYNQLKPMNFYPIGMKGITLLAIKNLFNFDNKKFQEMGRFGSKLHPVIRVFMKYFVSPEMFVSQAPRMWRSYYTIGECKVVEFNKEKRYVILRIDNFSYFPDHCQVLIGYFSNIFQMVINKEVTCEETKCVFKGDEYHEFLLKW